MSRVNTSDFAMSSSNTNNRDTPVYYNVKWILDHKGDSRPVCMQNRNGPCVLLALANALLITSETSISPGTTRVREDSLMGLLADYVSTRKPSSSSSLSEQDLAREYAVTDFLDLLPQLNRGMDVNIRFGSPLSFEFTRELSVFDVFPTIRLVHGWLVDPQDARLVVAFGNLSYNQLLDQLVQTAEVHEDEIVDVAPSAPPPDAFEERLATNPSLICDYEALRDHHDYINNFQYPELVPVPSMEPTPQESPETEHIREMRPFVADFLENNPTQMTVYGLHVLHETLREGETAVLFRNSHFHVIRKHRKEIYTLVTDVGFLNELNTVWEKLSDISGDSVFFTGDFKRVLPDGSVFGASESSPVVMGRPESPAPAASSSTRTQSLPSLRVSRNTSPQSSRCGTNVTQSKVLFGKKNKNGGKNGCVIQ